MHCRYLGTRIKGIGNEVLPIKKKSAPACSPIYNELELPLLNYFPTGCNLPLDVLFLNIMVKKQCFRGKQNMLCIKMKRYLYICVNKQVTWASEKRGANSYMANIVRKILNDLSFSYLLLTEDRGRLRGVRPTATSLRY